MAKMWKTRGLDCSKSFAWNARKVLGVRVAEVYAHAPSLDDPLDSRGHHDLRISIKRLRYSLEFFSVCYDPSETGEILSTLSAMQDLLGDLHDAEVLVPELQRVLGQLAEARQRAVRRLGRSRRSRRKPVSFETFSARFRRASESKTRPGILSLINQLRRQRQNSYRGIVDSGRVSTTRAFANGSTG